MATPNQRAAISSLDTARPIIARLDASRHPEDIAADIIEAWGATEGALRALLGGSPLAGQALLAEVGRRGLLSLAQTNALAGFLGARDRASRPDYRPTGSDVTAARDGFAQLDTSVERALATPETPPAGIAPSAAIGRAPALANTTMNDAYEPAPTTGRRFPLIPIVAGVLVLALAGGGAWWYMSTAGDRALDEGRSLFRAGNMPAARVKFEEAARSNQRDPVPHVYLGRIAREQGDLDIGVRELQTAITLDPGNALAQREMGQHLFATGNYELASKFYERAIRLDPTDRTAQGYFACTLLRMGRPQAAQTFFNRAGQGEWSRCMTAVPAPGTAPTP